MNTAADKTAKSKHQSVAAGIEKSESQEGATFQFTDNRSEAVAQRKLQSVVKNRPVSNLGVVQRLVGAAAPIVGHDAVLPGVAANRGAAALKIANYVNLRARETAPAGVGPAVHAASSDLGANNAGNLYVRSNYTVAGPAAASLETWSEMTGVGGGEVKRVRSTEAGVVVMDRVMNDPHPSALNAALTVNAMLGGGAAGTHQYGSVHAVQGGDAAALDISGGAAHAADNITKVVGEGARFGWLAEGLSNGTYGNASTGVFKVTIKVPQIGRFTMNPTFEDLWGAWNSAFGRKYMRDKKEAIAVLRTRMIQGWTRAQQGDVIGAAPLADGATAAGQVTSLTKGGVVKAVSRAVGNTTGAGILTDLSMTYHSAD